MAKSEGLPLWPVLAAAAIAVAGVLTAVFWPDPPTSLRVLNPQHNSAGQSTAQASAGKPYVYITYPLCVAHGSVTITRVTAHDPKDMKVVDWAASTSSLYPPNGDGAQDLAKKLYGFNRKTISHPCSNPQQFAISVERSGPIGVARGFDVESTSGTVLIPFTVALCAGDCPRF